MQYEQRRNIGIGVLSCHPSKKRALSTEIMIDMIIESDMGWSCEWLRDSGPDSWKITI